MLTAVEPCHTFTVGPNREKKLLMAQRVMQQQLRTNWSALLDRVLHDVYPVHEQLFEPDKLHYYWSADETEWATDIAFRSAETLDRLYPALVRQAINQLGCQDVLRFFGRRSSVQMLKSTELTSHLGIRGEGVRIKHSLERNSQKMYRKQPELIRLENTINNTRQMKVYRASEDHPQGPQSYQRLRKGVADLHRRAEISQKCNERYLEAIGSVTAETTLAEAAGPVCQRTTWHGRSARALNPLGEDDARLLQAISRGEFTMQGFRNRDLCRLLFPDTDLTDKQRMTKVTRLIRLLRAHALVTKVPKTHRDTITPRGHETITTLLAARNATVQQLSALAA